MVPKAWIQSLVARVTGIVSADVGTSQSINPATNGLASIGGTVAITAGQRILLTQGGATAGLYIASAGAWARATDYDTDERIRESVVRCKNWADTPGIGATVRNTNASAITVGTTSITYGQPETVLAGNTYRIGRGGSVSAFLLEIFANGGTTVSASIGRGSGTGGRLTINNVGASVDIITNNFGVRIGNASASPIFDIRKGSTTIAANTSVAAGATQLVSVPVAGAANSFGFCLSGTQGVAIPTGLTKVGEWCVTNGTVVVAFRNTTAAAISWPATATTLHACVLSI